MTAPRKAGDVNATFHDLRGKSVFITGGASGIGAALTEGFLAQGARVAFIDLEEAGDFTRRIAATHDPAPLAIQGDVTDTVALQSAMRRAAEHHGSLDVLVCNAANDLRHDWRALTPADWDSLQSVNLRAYFFAMQEAGRMMTEQGRGAIVNFSSISYMTGNTGMPAYTSANAAITSLTATMARELGPSGVRVNAIAPGWVLTDKQLEKWATPEDLAAHLERQSIKTHLAPRDMVDATLFLSSDASRMVTGQCLVVDGGVVGAR